MRYAYPVDVLQAGDGVTVICPDVPEMVNTGGATRAEALERAADALVTALSFYVDDGRAIPRPSPAHGRPVVSVTALEAAKLALHDTMLAAGLSNVELGCKLGLDEKSIRRLRDSLHRSHIGTVEAALRALGKRVEVSVTEAA
jgi:antitoxin HicB